MNIYNTNETIFIKSLIEKKDIKDCYTKAHALQKQGCDMFTLFWKIYVDYYAHIHPKLELFIMKKQNAWNVKKDNIHILCIIKNMFISNSSTNVYDLRMMDGGAEYIYIYQAETEDENKKRKKFTDLWTSIKKKHFKNTLHYLTQFIGDGENENIVNEVFNVIITYFSKYYGGADREKIIEKWKNRPHIPKHIIPYYLLAMVLHLYEDEENITQTATFVMPRNEEIEFYSGLV